MYTQELDSITFSDVDAFLKERHRESIILDYKEDWPNDLEKVIAAMANTQGGVILVGVSEEDKTGFPKSALGVEMPQWPDALRQKVISKAYQGIYPPVIPEVGVVELPNDPGRAIVIIRVSASVQAPHAIDNRRRVYVRIDSLTEPHSLADLGQLEWLWARREKAVAAAKSLIAASEERAAFMIGSTNRDTMPWFQASIVPRFCTGDPVIHREKLRNLYRNLLRQPIESLMDGNWLRFPKNSPNRRSVAGGFAVYDTYGGDEEYVELGEMGYLYSELSVGYEIPVGGQRLGAVNLWAFLSQLDGMLRLAHAMFCKGNPLGPVEIRGKLRHVKGWCLVGVENLGRLAPEDRRNRCVPTDAVSVIDATELAADLEARRGDLVREAAWHTLWSFGYGWEEATFEKWYAEKIPS